MNQKTWLRSHTRCCGGRRLVLCRYDVNKGRLLKCEQCGNVMWENGEEWNE